MQKISVLLAYPFSCCTYFADEKLSFGTYVKVPFGKSELIGVVWDCPVDNDFDEKKIKKINQVLDFPLMPKHHRDFIDWVADYTVSEAGAILKMSIPISDIDKQSKKPIIFDTPLALEQKKQLSDSQKKAADFITSYQGFKVCLIDGITGSGKTEVYFKRVEKTLAEGKQVLILLPEITLTAGFVERFEKHFGVKPALWHSGLTPKTRRDTWQAVALGKAKVLIGARSGLFLPFADLGLIVVDEEHDPSYKQEEGVTYQARDMAIVRAHFGKFPVILASATPSLETYANVLGKKYDVVHLKERYAGATLPDIDLIDMRQREKGEKGILSRTLINAIDANLKAQNQTLLFLNRRGYAPIRLCTACGEKIKCPHCSVFLTQHKHTSKMVCHQCGYTTRITHNCPVCGQENTLISCGSGVEKIEEEISKLFPDARIKLITSDTISGVADMQQLSDDLTAHKIDILIGTQILAKGHNFDDLTLVGIVDADFGLSGGDLRASERTFQLLQQVSGRAGRATKKGRVLLQTYSPENMVIQSFLKNNRDFFMDAEMQSRQLLCMPPFGRMASLIISAKNKDTCHKTASDIVKKIPLYNDIEILGPVAAPIYLLRGRYRERILIKSGKKIKLQTLIKKWIEQVKIPSSVNIKIDIDPYNFL